MFGDDLGRKTGLPKKSLGNENGPFFGRRRWLAYVLKGICKKYAKNTHKKKGLQPTQRADAGWHGPFMSREAMTKKKGCHSETARQVGQRLFRRRGEKVHKSQMAFWCMFGDDLARHTGEF